MTSITSPRYKTPTKIYGYAFCSELSTPLFQRKRVRFLLPSKILQIFNENNLWGFSTIFSCVTGSAAPMPTKLQILCLVNRRLGVKRAAKNAVGPSRSLQGLTNPSGGASLGAPPRLGKWLGWGGVLVRVVKQRNVKNTLVRLGSQVPGHEKKCSRC